MKHSMKKRIQSAGQSVMKQGKALLHREPEPAPAVSAEEKAFRKGQKDLDTAYRAVHEALSQKDMTKAQRHAKKVKQHFDVLFKAHEKARRR